MMRRKMMSEYNELEVITRDDDFDYGDLPDWLRPDEDDATEWNEYEVIGTEYPELPELTEPDQQNRDSQ
jgi:hypothetical protein